MGVLFAIMAATAVLAGGGGMVARAAEPRMIGVLDCVVKSDESERLQDVVDVSCRLDRGPGGGDVTLYFGAARFSSISIECACSAMLWLVFAHDDTPSLEHSFRRVRNPASYGYTFTEEALAPRGRGEPILQPVTLDKERGPNLAIRVIRLDLGGAE